MCIPAADSCTCLHVYCLQAAQARADGVAVAGRRIRVSMAKPRNTGPRDTGPRNTGPRNTGPRDRGITDRRSGVSRSWMPILLFIILLQVTSAQDIEKNLEKYIPSF